MYLLVFVVVFIIYYGTPYLLTHSRGCDHQLVIICMYISVMFFPLT